MTAQYPTPDERDERVAMPLDPLAALRALLQVKPEQDRAETNQGDVVQDSTEPDAPHS